MRLRNIYLICRKNYYTIANIIGKDTIVNNRDVVRVTNWASARAAIVPMLEIDYLSDQLRKLFDSVPEAYRTNADFFIISNGEWTKIRDNKNAVLIRMKHVIELYESLNLNDAEAYGIDIKLPECKDLSDLKSVVSDLEFVLSKCIFLKHEKETFRFGNFDVGSAWMILFVAGANITLGSVLLANLSAFIDRCQAIKVHKNYTRMQEEQIRSMQIDTDAKEIVLKGITDLYKQQVEKELKELEARTGINIPDGDEAGRAEECMERFNKLIDKGLEIYSALDSPPEVQAQFEPLKMYYLNAKAVGQIEQQGEEDDEN